MSLAFDFDLRSFYDRICAFHLEQKAICRMSREEVETLVECVNAHIRQTCRHCLNFRPLHLNSPLGTCGLSGKNIDNADSPCRYLYDTVPF